MFERYLSIAAAAALATVAPGFAAAAQTTSARPATNNPGAAAQPVPNRAALSKNLETNFRSFDGNRDGTLNQAEVAAAEARGVQARVAQARAQVESQFTKLDTNRDGQLSKTEFMAAAPQPPAVNGANVLAALDKNKDAKVTLDEYRNPMLLRFDAADTNKDGALSVAEREAFQRSAQAQRR